MSLQQPAKQCLSALYKQWGYHIKLLVQVSMPVDIRASKTVISAWKTDKNKLGRGEVRTAFFAAKTLQIKTKQLLSEDSKPA